MSRASTTAAARGFIRESTIGVAAATPNELIRRIEQGLPMRALESLALGLGMGLPEVAGHVGIPARTLARRKTAGRLSPEESERVVRVARLFEKAVALFDGDGDGARQWMHQPKQALAGQRPIDYARTEIGAREVENLLGRIEHGVFS
ncbi:MAG TPA: antitoxin Xre/MbcA/ParS toxin-binding domain-containing protein [Terracidiphilus sp.]|jgi:putative toxin-antitoxin system antitoxin component (TIGR02293 family)|nr:antitoxin Xre/MbcA/ParS toxin-binding domain-containing protein [Terracidiphilus sp.]